MEQREAPSFAAAYHQLGYRLKRQGNLDGAISLYRNALEASGNNPQILANLGCALMEQGRLDDAFDAFSKAVELTPDSAPAQINLGVILARKGRTGEALAAFQKAVELEPQLPMAHRNLGDALREEDQLEQAIAAYRCAIQLKPDYGPAYVKLAVLLCETGRVDEAIAVFESAMLGRPDVAEIHWNYALALLLKGDFVQGWREYEWRWKWPEFRSPRRNFRAPQWDGSDLAGRTLLLHAEQGLGDAIQFVRYVPIVAARGRRVGAQVILECPPELARLLKGIGGIDRLIVTGEHDEPPSHFDLHCPLMTLPGILGTDATKIPASIPYLRVPEPEVAKWSAKIAQDPSGYRVGLVWAGSPTHVKDRRRSIDPNLLLPLSQVKRVVFYNLQIGSSSPLPEGLNPVDHRSEIKDFADTAALVDQLDLLITVDTAAAHLAGAMGKKVWTLLPYAPDWRWQLGRPDSPWYPTIRLFRQENPGDWKSVISEITNLLISETNKN
jgi:Flp pilus assembly protein TadD